MTQKKESASKSKRRVESRDLEREPTHRVNRSSQKHQPSLVALGLNPGVDVLGHGLVGLAGESADGIGGVVELESDHETSSSNVGDEVGGLGGGSESSEGGKELGGSVRNGRR